MCAHNSHLGNAGATDRSRHGEWNLGQLVREIYSQAVLVGFTTYTGTVTAASDWGGPLETKRVRPALPGSYEALFTNPASRDFWLRSPAMSAFPRSSAPKSWSARSG